MSTFPPSTPPILAITGSIGSGKSLVCQMLTSMGVRVISLDSIAKQLLAHNSPLYQETLSHFGVSIQDLQGALDRRALRQMISTQKEAKKWLEARLHPKIREELVQRLSSRTNAPYQAVEIPLLFERTPNDPWQRILWIYSPDHLALQRSAQRDQCSLEEVTMLRSQQPSIRCYAQLADDCLLNLGSTALLEAQVKALHQYYLLWDG